MKGLRTGTRSTRAAYLVAAVLVRSLDAGATVGVVLVALASTEIGDPVRLGALVGAAITLPHVLGPWTARLLARVRDQRRAIAVAAIWFAALLAAVALATGRLPGWSLMLLAGAAGLAGPILTGGLSSQVATALGAGRRSVSWDALTYGISATLAPALVATTAAVVGAVPGVLALSGLGVAGGVVALLLPRPLPPTPSSRMASSAEAADDSSAVGMLTVARYVVTDRDMRAVVALTWAGAFLTAAALIAGLAKVAATAPAASGQVAAALGLGGLLGSAALIRWPLRQRARSGLVVTTLLLSLCCLAAAAVSGVTLLLVAFGLLGLLNAPHTVFSLAAREELPPPQLRQDVFVAVAGTKVAFSSLGTATAGVLAGLGPTAVLVAVAGVGIAAAGAAALRRPRTAVPRATASVPSASGR